MRGTRRNHELSAAAVVLASGSGSRVAAELNKAYLPLAGMPLVTWSLRALGGLAGVSTLVLVTRPEDSRHVEAALAELPDVPTVEVVTGGGDRQQSELHALRHLAGRIESGAIDVVLLHDAARPLVSARLAGDVLATAAEHGGALPGLSCSGLGVVAEDGVRLRAHITATAVRAQTPQGFHAGELLAAYESAARDGFVGTDTAACVERYTNLAVRWVDGEHRNIKVTYAEDITVAERLLRLSVAPEQSSSRRSDPA